MTVRTQMESGEQLLGTFVQLRDPTAAEFGGRLGLDFLCIEAEHSGHSTVSVQSMVSAAALAPAPALVRVAGGDPIVISAALDAGAEGIIVPRIDTAAQAAAVAAWARYPPKGGRGLGPGRAAGFGATIPQYLARANRELLVAIQVETAAAVDNLDALLAVDGIDMIFVGPGDLACSLGIADMGGPEMQEIVASVLTRTAAAGRLRGVFAPTAAHARAWRESGAELVILGSDLSWLAAGVSGAVAAARDAG
jgi:4-hydroxy-2-oxoheptanedioate aldolase